MPAGEITATDRLRNYQVKRRKEDVHKNFLLAETESKFREQFDDEFNKKDQNEVKSRSLAIRR